MKKLINYINIFTIFLVANFGLLSLVSELQGRVRTSWHRRGRTKKIPSGGKNLKKMFHPGYIKFLHRYKLCNRKGILNTHASHRNYSRAFTGFFRKVCKRGIHNHMSSDLVDWIRGGHPRLNYRDRSGHNAFFYAKGKSYYRKDWYDYLRKIKNDRKSSRRFKRQMIKNRKKF